MPITAAKRWNISDQLVRTLQTTSCLGCPLCGKRGFTLTGIQQHRCRKLPTSRIGKLNYHDRLTDAQVTAAINFAIPF